LIPGLSRSDILNKQIAVPPTVTEQNSIASSLSDVDALIISLEKLIAKKRAIKQGAMQELLTGKRRLPGFSGKWETKKLGEIGEITGAGIDKKSRPNEVPVKLVNYLDVFRKDFIYSKDLNHWVTAPTAQAQRCAVKKGDVFFTPSSEMRWDIGISAVAMEDIPDAGYSYHVDRLRLFDDWDLAFRTYIFKTKNFLDQAETICEGSGKRYVISLTKFRELTVKYSVNKTEQTAIANILSDMDTEINSLEQKRDKYIMLKQGMMQVLLTGKVRLI
jgi:type I restriction enzyme S subunit